MATTEVERPNARGRRTRPGGRVVARAVIVTVSLVVGFMLVAQVRAGVEFDARLQIEREDDLARILSDLSAETDRLQREITERRLLLFEFERTAADDQLALRSLQDRLADLQVLTGSVPVEGDEGVGLRIEDPARALGPAALVDAVQELRDAGAEALAVNDVRLVASSAFEQRNDRMILDGQAIAPPYVIEAIGPAAALQEALGIPGGIEQTLAARADQGVRATVELLGRTVLPARAAPHQFVYGTPVSPEDTSE